MKIYLMLVVTLILMHPINSRIFGAMLFLSDAQTVGRIEGVVKDPNGAVIPNATVIVEGGPIKRTVVTNEDGFYKVDVPSGIYQITTNIIPYYPLRRAAFRVKPESAIIINLSPPIRVLTAGLEVTREGSREFTTISPQDEYMCLHIAHSSDIFLNLLIRSTKHQVRKNRIEFTDAVASYDNLTIYADRVYFETKTDKLEAEGNVTVEDGNKTMRVKSARISFSKNGANLEVFNQSS